MSQGVIWESESINQPTKFQIELVPTGTWKYDGDKGKWMVVIKIVEKTTGKALSFVPRHDDVCQGILAFILEAEMRNDLFQFKDPKFNGTRPRQFAKKLAQIRETVSQSKRQAIERGILDGSTNLVDWL